MKTSDNQKKSSHGSPHNELMRAPNKKVKRFLGLNRGGFSWKRFFGISAYKAKISRTIGIPLTHSGRQRKLGAWVEKALWALGAAILAFIYSFFNR